MVRLGNEYPLFFDRDFSKDPARLGHEAAFTVIQVGKQWEGKYYPGQRLGIQPDVYVQGKRVILGVNIPGAMTQYTAIPKEVLSGDEGSYVFPVPPELTYVDVALLEPWACVDAAYTPRRRLEPKNDGVLWIKGRPGAPRTYTMSRPLNSAQVILSDVPHDLAAWVLTQTVEVVERNGVDGSALVDKFTDGVGFDDIILLDPRKAGVVSGAADCLSQRGVLNIVSAHPLDAPVSVDVGRLHYGPVAYLGCMGPDIAQAYGVDRNRSELVPGGVTCVVGAGGPMGRMHVQRALEMTDGPRAVIATDTVEARLDGLMRGFSAMAEAKGCEFTVIKAGAEPERLQQEAGRLTGGVGCDDIVVMVPSTRLIEEAVRCLSPDGMLVLFAGVPLGSRALLPLDNVYLHNVQFTGTSGSTVADELRVLEKVKLGTLSPARSLGAIVGLMGVAEGFRAVMEGVFPGKVVIFPQLPDLPLLSLAELKTALPDVYAGLGPDETWTARAEKALFERYL